MIKTNKLISLDSLFDVTLACFIKLYPNRTEELFKAGYFLRSSNILSKLCPWINDKEIASLWENRNLELLKISYSTNIVNVLSLTNQMYRHVDEDAPDGIDMSITINVYPYVFPPKELKAFFRVLKLALGLDKLLCISKPTKAITVDFIKTNKFDHFIINDFALEWTNFHAEELVTQPIPLVQVTCPIIHVDNEFGKWTDMPIQPEIYDGISRDYGRRIKVDLRPLADFSICPPLKPTKEEEE